MWWGTLGTPHYFPHACSESVKSILNPHILLYCTVVNVVGYTWHMTHYAPAGSVSVKAFYVAVHCGRYSALYSSEM